MATSSSADLVATIEALVLAAHRERDHDGSLGITLQGVDELEWLRAQALRYHPFIGEWAQYTGFQYITIID